MHAKLGMQVLRQHPRKMIQFEKKDRFYTKMRLWLNKLNVILISTSMQVSNHYQT